MPIIKSAKKRVRVAQKATTRNVKTKRSLKTALKAFQAAVTGGKKSADAHSKAQSELDKAVKKGVIHKNKAARKKKQLAAKAGKPSAGAKKAAKPAAAKKTTTTKKAPAKKPTKKPAAKKTAKK
jgi:small subunit ribosomal protein S20